MPALTKEAFFAEMDSQGLALTFDDVLLETGPSEFASSEVDLSSRFSENVPLRIPMVSAAMDTVTDSRMAIAMAYAGGLGIVHAGFDVDEQRRELRRVKLFMNGLITDPVCVSEEQTVKEALNMCEEKGYGFRTFPVIDNEGHFVGLLTQKDFTFAVDKTLPIKVAMTAASKIIKAPPDTTIEDAYQIMIQSKKKTLPLVSEDGTVAGLYVFSDVERIVGGDTVYNVDGAGKLRVGAAISTDDAGIERLGEIAKYLDVVVLDSAQGDSRFAIETYDKVRNRFSGFDVVVGNISSAASARMWAERGADGIKVGQGPGSICTTRVETGIGSPQITAVYQCMQAVRSFRGSTIPICADGGLKDPGNISLAIAAGADSVMMGNMLAATDEAPGEIIERGGVRYMLYRGMGSPSALRESASSRARYGIHGTGLALAEGVEALVPLRGSVINVLGHYVAALRKSMSYVGSDTIASHQRNTRFVKATNAGMRESHPHDVSVITL